MLSETSILWLVTTLVSPHFTLCPTSNIQGRWRLWSLLWVFKLSTIIGTSFPFLLMSSTVPTPFTSTISMEFYFSINIFSPYLTITSLMTVTMTFFFQVTTKMMVLTTPVIIMTMEATPQPLFAMPTQQ